MDDTERRLLDAIIDAPADDAPRLVYADWLQQRGDPRGEHLALQLAGSRNPHAVSWDRIRELEAAHADSWIPTLLRHAVPGNLHFVRGFIEHLELDADGWLSHGAELVRCAPVQHLSLRPAERVREVLEVAHAQRLRSFGFGLNEHPTANVLAGLDRVPPLPNLDRLSIAYAGLDDGGAFALAKLPVSPLEIQANGNRFGTEALAALLAGPLGRRVRRLALWGTQLGDALVDSLHGAANLCELELGMTGATAAVVRPLAARRPHLEVLDLSFVPFNATSIRRLAFDGLRRLVLDGSGLGDDGVVALCEIVTTQLPALRSLALRNCNIRGPGVLALAACDALDRLDDLDLEQNRFDHDARDALGRRFGERVRTRYRA